jgi:GDPmannose 4,6-dehydratase
MRKALISGITGQDGSYLAEFLLQKGYEVHGIIRRSSTFNTKRIMNIFQENGSLNQTLFLHYGDLMDPSSISNLISNLQPQEIYNLAAQSHVKVSFEIPIYTSEVTAIGALNILEAARNLSPKSKIYQASSSEMFGNSQTPQNENTAFLPESPYAVSKLFAFQNCENYKNAYDMFISNGILFNHESIRRGETFVTRKISRAVARIYLGLQDKLELGNLDAVRDWGFAPEYVEAMWLMLQQEQPENFVIATGETASVNDFASVAFATLNLDSSDFVVQNPNYLRPNEVNFLKGDATKANQILNWIPKTNWKKLAERMVLEDLEIINSRSEKKNDEY